MLDETPHHVTSNDQLVHIRLRFKDKRVKANALPLIGGVIFETIIDI